MSTVPFGFNGLASGVEPAGCASDAARVADEFEFGEAGRSCGVPFVFAGFAAFALDGTASNITHNDAGETVVSAPIDEPVITAVCRGSNRAA